MMADAMHAVLATSQVIATSQEWMASCASRMPQTPADVGVCSWSKFTRVFMALNGWLANKHTCGLLWWCLQAIAHLSGSCFFDLSPGNTDGTYPGKAVAMLLHLVFKVTASWAVGVFFVVPCF